MGNLNSTYINIVNKYYPNVQASSNGFNYSDITWISGGPINQNELESKMIDYAKEKRILEISEDCENHIMSGFQSSALGTPHIYDSEFVDQINLVGACINTAPMDINSPDGFSMYYACRDVVSGIKNYFEHTHQQLRMIIYDGSMFKLQNLQIFHFKRMAIQECLTIEEVDAITWTSPF